MHEVAILGAGSGGMAIAAVLSREGCNVRLYDKYEDAIRGIAEAGGITLQTEDGEDFVRVGLITTSIEEAIAGAELILIITPAFAHRELAVKCAPFLVNGQIVILSPGRTAGALEFYNAVMSVNPQADFTVGEAQTLVYACRKTAPSRVRIHRAKRKVRIAAMPAIRTGEVIEKISQFFPEFEPAENVLETSLLNIGAIFHPAPTILNITRIERREEFEFYIDGITPCVSHILEALDRERISLAEAFRVPTLTAKEWLRETYGVEGEEYEPLYVLIRRQKGYHGILAPQEVLTRYIVEDVPTGLVPLSELASIVGVPTPLMDAVIAIASVIHQRDYRKIGRNLHSLGISGMSLEEILSLVERGAAKCR